MHILFLVVASKFVFFCPLFFISAGWQARYARLLASAHFNRAGPSRTQVLSASPQIFNLLPPLLQPLPLFLLTVCLIACPFPRQVCGSVQPHRAGAAVCADCVGQHHEGAGAHRGRTDPPCAAERSVELCESDECWSIWGKRLNSLGHRRFADSEIGIPPAQQQCCTLRTRARPVQTENCCARKAIFAELDSQLLSLPA